MNPFVLPIVTTNGFIVTTTNILGRNQNDANELVSDLPSAFRFLKALKLDIIGGNFNEDKAFEMKGYRRTGFNHGFIPSGAENKQTGKMVSHTMTKIPIQSNSLSLAICAFA